MSNPYEQFVNPDAPQSGGNPYAAFVHAPTVDEKEQDVISRVNNPRVESPRHFGFVEFPATIANEFWRPIVTIPGEIGSTVMEAGELAQGMEGKSTLEIAQTSFLKRLTKNIQEGDSGVKALLQTIWGTEKDIILSQLPDAAAPTLVNGGKAMMEQNDAATNWMLGAPKEGFAADIGGGFGSVARTIGAWYIAGAGGAGAMMVLAVNTSAYKEARKKLDPEDAAAVAFSDAVIQGKLESIGTDVFTAVLHGSSFFKKWLFRSAEQTLEETVQQAGEETVMDVGGVRDLTFDEKLHNILYAGALGFIVGAPTSVVFTKMEDVSRGYGIDPKEIKKQIEAFIKNKDQVIDGAAEILNREASGITKDEPARADALKAMQGVIAEQEKIDTAIAEGSTQDPQIAARILMKTATPEVRAAIEVLPEGFTMEQLQAVAGQPIPDMTLEASSAPSLNIPYIQTPEFKARFEGSKVVDEAGTPLRVYHGTKSDFTQFEVQKIRIDDRGFWFSSADVANRFADAERAGDTGAPNVRPAYLKLENPYYHDANSPAKPGMNMDDIFSAARKGGHDGIVFKSKGGKSDTYVAFSPDQIIPAFGDGKPPSQPPGTPPSGGTGDGGKRAIYQQLLDAEKQANRFSTEGGKEFLSNVSSALSKALTPISTRLRNINPKLAARLREFEFDHNKQINADSAIAKPFLEKFHKLSREDRTIMDFAMKNGDMETINEIAAANNMTAEIEALRVMFDDLYKRGKKVNLDIGYRKGFFPRLVENPKKLLAYFGKTEAWNDIQQAIKNKEMELGAPLTVEEKAHLINTLLRGYQTAGITLAKPGALKERSIDQVTPEINEFYATTDQAILRYITTVNDAIETRNFLGKDAETIEDSIGAFVLRELEKGTLNPNQAQELSEILKARFHQGKMNPLLKAYKNLSYIDTMGSPISAITQLGGISYSLSNNGFYRVLKSIPGAVADKSEITLEDIGVDRIAEEFSDGGTTGNAVRKVFKLVGLQKLDRLDKLTFINSTLLKFRDLAKKPSKEFKASLENIFEEETDSVISDLQNGVNSENVKLLLFNEILDMQPLTKSEMPELYLSNPNGRIFYMLKSFTLKQYDIYRKQVFDEIRSGNKVKGLSNLVRLTAFFVMMNAGADFLKDLLLNRETPPEDQVVNNIARVFGFSKYQVYSVRREGFGTAAFKTIAPPFKAVDSMSKDMAKAIDEGEVDIDDLETVQSIPIAGKFYYWWFGAGADK